MIKILLFCLIIIASIQFSWCQTDCTKFSGTNCESCLNNSGCAFCKTEKTCHKWSPTDVSPPCSTSDLQYQTCVADAQTLAIILGSVGAAVLLIIIVFIVCICRAMRRRRLRGLQKDEYKNSAALEARRAAAEERSREREAKNDAIRMKYNLPGSGPVEYRRMS